jgi:hypothetical protein
MTKDGEAIDFEGDIDEFSFDGTAIQSISTTIQAPFAFDGGLPTARHRRSVQR